MKDQIYSSILDRFASISLKQKVLLTITGVSFIVVLLSLSVSAYIEIRDFRERLREQYDVTCELMASNLEAAVSFQDSYDSQELLNSLKTYKSIKEAKLFLINGTILASYKLNNQDKSINLQAESKNGFNGDELCINTPIEVDGEKLAELIVFAKLKEYQTYLLAKIFMYITMLLLALIIAHILSQKLGTIITTPILALTSTAKKITDQQDFSIRHESRSKDEVGHLIKTFNNMIAQIENQNDLIQSNILRFRSYFDLGIVGMAILDQHFKFKETNLRLSEILGYRKDEFTNLNLVDFFDDSTKPIQKDVLFLTSEKTDRLSGECWIPHKHGHEVYISISIRKIPETKTIARQYTVLVQDITERKRNELELIQAKERAESSNKAKDEFLSVMSHELRTPLNPIIGFTELIIMENENPNIGGYLNKINQSADHLLKIIDSILDYTRIEKGIVDINNEQVDYNEICETAVDSIKQGDFCNENIFTIEHKVIGLNGKWINRPQVNLDKTKTSQVLLNFVTNAAKFTHKGSIQVKTYLKAKDSKWADLTFTVIDTGIGIKENQLEEIFKPFQQADNSLSRKHGGIGLGLSVCKKLVNLLGGDIGCESKPNKGSKFWFIIPVKIAHPTPKKIKKTKTEEKCLIQNQTNGKKILIVEDDPTNMELITTMTQKLGYHAELAFNGQDGLVMAKKENYEFILMDIQMPDMDGFKATKSIRDFKKTDIPIIAITAHVGISEREYKNAGMTALICKPFSFHQLKSVIHNCLPKS